MKAEPLALAVEAVRADGNHGKVISFSNRKNWMTMMSRLSQKAANLWFLSAEDMKGSTKRFLDSFVDETYSIGDYVLSGGELPAMVMLDAIVRRTSGSN